MVLRRLKGGEKDYYAAGEWPEHPLAGWILAENDVQEEYTILIS